MKYSYILVLIISLSSTFFLQNSVKAESSKDNFPNQTISIDNMTLDVMVADTPDRRTLGLQYQQQLPYNQGMLFVLPTPQDLPIWMPNMQFSLDIIWFDSNGNVLHIERNVPPCTSSDLSTCPVYNREGQPAQYALEVTSGFVDKNNISMNSKLAIPIPEFGFLAGMIMTISTIVVVILSKRFRFHFYR